jgi:hypothetical protein
MLLSEEKEKGDERNEKLKYFYPLCNSLVIYALMKNFLSFLSLQENWIFMNLYLVSPKPHLNSSLIVMLMINGLITATFSAIILRPTKIA